MRAGRLKIKRYKLRHRRRGWILCLLLAAGAAAFLAFRQHGAIPLFAAPAATLSPAESARETREFTLPGRTWYALQLGAFETEDMALSLAASYQARGAAGYIDESDHYRVLAAAYDSRASAQAVQTQLGALHGVDAYVSEITRAEVTLRLTGQRAQLTALTDAYDALNHAAENLYALSLGLDQREKTGEEVRSAALSEKETAENLSLRLNTLFGENAPEAVSFITEVLNGLKAALEKALSSSGDTALGAQIKYCQLLCIERMAAYARMLQP